MAYRAVVRFLIKAGVVFIAWTVIYQLWIKPDGSADHFIVKQLTHTTDLILGHGGYDMIDNADKPSEGAHRYTGIVNTPLVVYVGDECNGLNLMALFIGFMFIYPGSWKQKWWFILLGLITIHASNQLRILALTVLSYHLPESVDFNHTYTFTIIVYGIVFSLWYLWAKKFSVTHSSNHAT